MGGAGGIWEGRCDAPVGGGMPEWLSCTVCAGGVWVAKFDPAVWRMADENAVNFPGLAVRRVKPDPANPGVLYTCCLCLGGLVLQGGARFFVRVLREATFTSESSRRVRCRRLRGIEKTAHYQSSPRPAARAGTPRPSCCAWVCRGVTE